jgi:anthranilate synthase component II
MKILVFDNYDSFTYNLVHLVEKIRNQKVEVFRNDQIALEKIKEFDKIILSPGPGIPCEAGLLLPLIREYAASKSILGVCLGLQAIGEAFGGKLINLSTVYHGVATLIRLENPASGKKGKALGESGKDHPSPLFEGLPSEFEAGRYHSWILSEVGFPEVLEITARDENRYVMALQHKTYDVQAVQFHPESVLTPLGEKIMNNWLKN